MFNNSMQNYNFNPEQVNAILNYLSQKPYGEVANLINMILGVVKSTDEPKKEVKNGEWNKYLQ